MATLRLTFPLLVFPLLVGLTRVSVGVALAQPAATPEATPAIDCQNANSTVEINYCAELSYQKADVALNQAYSQLQASLSGDRKAKLTAAEQAWIEYRDKNCKFEVRSAIGGTGYSAFLNGCLETMTQARIQDLKRQ
jgi:uncharacterized protein YecT (DUF1311 family)